MIEKNSLPFEDEAFKNELLNCIKEGLSDKAIAGYMGIHPTTFAYWMRMGLRDPNAETPFGVFYREVLRAKAEREKFHMEKIRGSKSYQAHTWVLTHLEPDTYGQHQRIEISTLGRVSPEDVQRMVRELSDEEMELYATGKVTLEALLAPKLGLPEGVE